MHDPQKAAIPRIVISALRGGSGKTVITLGIVAALKRLGKKIAVFKKGPDYIDAGWLAKAADRACYNLDTFLLLPEVIRHSFHSHTTDHDIALIEGNRGLYDGIDTEGLTSTAELAKLLGAPVLLCLDCTKSTRTMAAIVQGCVGFDREVRIRGVILNRVAGARHENVLRQNIESHCGVPVVGALPKLKRESFPERHMGLIPTPEHAGADASIEAAAAAAEDYIDLEAVLRIARELEGERAEMTKKTEGTQRTRGAQRTEETQRTGGTQKTGGVLEIEEEIQSHPQGLTATDRISQDIPLKSGNIRIGVIRDSAFQFYYPENIDALKRAGAEVLFISPLAEKGLPRLDGLYIGGGFPETHGEQLAENLGFKADLKDRVEDGLPIYAECGGLMYLGEELRLAEGTFPMTGILPAVFDVTRRPQGHGYTVITVSGENPYFSVGTKIRGHEFHYSRVIEWRGGKSDLVFSVDRGVGLHEGRDGAVHRNVLATYTHIHALGVPEWGPALVCLAQKYRSGII